MTKIDDSTNRRPGAVARRALEPTRLRDQARTLDTSGQVEIRSVLAAVSA